MKWAQRCQLPSFAKLARTIRAQRAGIEAAIQPITRRAYGYDTPQPLIALAMLTLSALRPTLPGRLT